MQWLSRTALVAVALAVPVAVGCDSKMSSTTSKMSSSSPMDKMAPSSSPMDKMDKDKMMMTDKEKMDKEKMSK